MSGKKLTDEERISAVTAYMEENGSCNSIAKEYVIDACETKVNAVNDYLSGKYSLYEPGSAEFKMRHKVA